LLNIIPHQSAQAVSFLHTTTFYTISGELCYNSEFMESYGVSGVVGVRLASLGTGKVQCEEWGYLQEGTQDPDSLVESVLVEDRKKSDGNYTLFYIDLPVNATIHINTLDKNALAQYCGERYVSIGAKSVRTSYYCYVVAEVQSILRFEWYFEWDSGILLKFTKSIAVNFARVQWLDYTVKNTTLYLAGTHPVTAFFANVQEHFFAGTGAVIGVILFYYILTRNKFQRSQSL